MPKTVLLWSAIALGAAAWATTVSVAPPAGAVCRLPAELEWKSNPRVHGLQTAVLAGDPRAAGPYAQRIKFPPHFRLEPHSHPNEARMVTVLSGTLYFAYGTKFDESQLKRLPPGSFFTEPKDVPHYAMTGEKGVVLELHAIGPDGTNYVKEK
ncbi:MAG TPA: cupin domain-containing protein [Thermoguttaceae bacterium]|nr:cupin domain-containing protein [Thermoguttaceae bacterium]